MTTNPAKTFSPEVRARAVRMVPEHEGEHASQWAAISSIAAKTGCTAEMLRLPPPGEQQSGSDVVAGRDLFDAGARLVTRRNQPKLVLNAPPTATLPSGNNLNRIRH